MSFLTIATSTLKPTLQLSLQDESVPQRRKVSSLEMVAANLQVFFIQLEMVAANLGVTAASATAITIDEVLDLYHSLKSAYRKNANFLVNDATIKAIRKLKDGQGQYLWQPSVQAGTPDTILNRPVVTSQYMPVAAAGEKTILFGDFKYYWIADCQGRTFKRLNELYAANGQVGFLASQRLDAKLILPEAIKVLQQKA